MGGKGYTIEYANSDGTKEKQEFDYVIGADGANSRVAKGIGAGEYNYAIAFQERIKISDEKMKFYEELAEVYVGDDVSPDFYGWVFPKYDHVGVGTGTVINRPAIKEYVRMHVRTYVLSIALPSRTIRTPFATVWATKSR